MVGLLLAAAVAASLTLAGPPRKRPIQYADLPPQLREALLARAVSNEGFADFIGSLEQKTAERLRLGENDHLVAFLLQSQRFTRRPRIEPALSAREFVESLPAEERERYLDAGASYLPPLEKVPQPVTQRFQDFIRALNTTSAKNDERVAYFREWLRRQQPSSEAWLRYLAGEYARSMRFLYRKEFFYRNTAPAERGRYVASLYQQRGHSTDTQVEANFAVFQALAVLKALEPSLELNRVLIVGPGLDFAPRTDLVDAFPPQSYQPFAVADALLGLKLAQGGKLAIHCVDINQRVVRYLEQFPKSRQRQVTFFSAIPERAGRAWTAEYREYFQNLGRNIGVSRAAGPLPPQAPSLPRRTVRVRSDVTERITAEQWNILTERHDPSPHYDLVVVTNVFTYFDATELALALSNIHALLRGGGYLVHNELQEELEALGKVLGLNPIQARTLRLTVGEDAPLLDGFVVQRKEE